MIAIGLNYFNSWRNLYGFVVALFSVCFIVLAIYYLVRRDGGGVVSTRKDFTGRGCGHWVDGVYVFVGGEGSGENLVANCSNRCGSIVDTVHAIVCLMLCSLSGAESCERHRSLPGRLQTVHYTHEICKPRPFSLEGQLVTCFSPTLSVFSRTSWKRLSRLFTAVYLCWGSC